MKTYQSEALTLRTYPYSENHRIVVFFTRDFGKVRGVAHGARTPRSKFSGALEPLTHLRVTFKQKEHADLVVIGSCDVIRAVPVQECTWEEYLHLSYFAELLLEFSREQEESDMVFRLTQSVLGAIKVVSIDVLARYFELWLLHLEGILPPLEKRLPAELVRKVRPLMKVPAAELPGELLSPAELKQLESLCGDLIEYHLERHLKTRKLLKELTLGLSD